MPKVYRCDSSGCALVTRAGGTTHGQFVTGIATQDIYDGQDSAYTTASTRLQRSGIAQEAEIYYYNIGCWYTGLANAIQSAIADQVDVFNMSFTFDVCDNDFNHSSVNEKLKDALAAGILPVAATGNAASSLTDSCEIGWPSYRPEVIAVSGLATTVQDSDYLQTNVAIGATSLGGMSVCSRSGSCSNAAGVDLVAPAVLRRMVTGTAYQSGDLWGSSLATPQVTGSAALLRHALGALGSSGHGHSGGELLTNMLLMGDGSNGWNLTDTAYGFDRTKPNPRSGYGRLTMWYPSSSSLTAPWGGAHIN